jgi:hypothetical protein
MKTSENAHLLSLPLPVELHRLGKAKEDNMITTDIYSQTDYVALVERADFSNFKAEPAEYFAFTVEYDVDIPQDFVEAMNDFNSGNVVDLDVALNQKPSDEA